MYMGGCLHRHMVSGVRRCPGFKDDPDAYVLAKTRAARKSLQLNLQLCLALGINVKLVRFTPRAKAVLLPKPDLPVARLEGDKGSLGHLLDILCELLECGTVG